MDTIFEERTGLVHKADAVLCARPGERIIFFREGLSEEQRRAARIQLARWYADSNRVYGTWVYDEARLNQAMGGA